MTIRDMDANKTPKVITNVDEIVLVIPVRKVRITGQYGVRR